MTEDQAVDQIIAGLDRMIRPLVRGNVPVPLILRALRDIADSLEAAQRRVMQ